MLYYDFHAEAQAFHNGKWKWLKRWGNTIRTVDEAPKGFKVLCYLDPVTATKQLIRQKYNGTLLKEKKL